MHLVKNNVNDLVKGVIMMGEAVRNPNRFQLTSFQLRIIAMVAMFCDHAYKTIGLGGVWMTYIGRIAFPIFAFQLVEGYFHTRDYKSYCSRLLIFALLSEIPYNMMSPLGGIINIFEQNVLWTMLVGMILIKLIDTVMNKVDGAVVKTIMVVLLCVIGYLVGKYIRVDYHGEGVLTFVVFYFARRYKKYSYIIQFVGLFILNYMLLGQVFLFDIFGISLKLPIQCLAILSLPLIWLYHGKQGYYSKAWSRFCYWFYPLHILLLVLAQYFIV